MPAAIAPPSAASTCAIHDALPTARRYLAQLEFCALASCTLGIVGACVFDIGSWHRRGGRVRLALGRCLRSVRCTASASAPAIRAAIVGGKIDLMDLVGRRHVHASGRRSAHACSARLRVSAAHCRLAISIASSGRPMPTRSLAGDAALARGPVAGGAVLWRRAFAGMSAARRRRCLARYQRRRCLSQIVGG